VVKKKIDYLTNQKISLTIFLFRDRCVAIDLIYNSQKKMQAPYTESLQNLTKTKTAVYLILCKFPDSQQTNLPN
jgi:hypothetical protein